MKQTVGRAITKYLGHTLDKDTQGYWTNHRFLRVFGTWLWNKHNTWEKKNIYTMAYWTNDGSTTKYLGHTLDKNTQGHGTNNR